MTHLPADRVLAFVDFLGFGSLVRRMETDDSLYNLIRTNLSSIRRDLAEREKNKGVQSEISGYEGYHFPLEQTQFSDSLVISADASLPRAAENVLYAVSSLSDRLLREGLFIRGGISRGWAHHEDNIVFGRAMVDAYELESKVANYPRIIVADSVFEMLTNFERKHAVCRDADGLWFSKPFTHLWYGDQIAIPDPDQLEKVRQIIVHALDSVVGNASLTSKYRWLANRYNAHIEECVSGMWRNMKLSTTPEPIDI